MSRSVIFVADSLDNAHKFQQVLSKMDLEVNVGSSAHFKNLFSQNCACDLVIYEINRNVKETVSEVSLLVADKSKASILFIVPMAQLSDFQPSPSVKCDFVVQGASKEECETRIKLLLNSELGDISQEIITIENMSINLATYQVTVGDIPLDLTYLEYALLAFLVTHPKRTYSRDTLLSRVWGFDYYGGSRTVDVHVRRVRAKLGPELAQHLETVRGVGYLWNF